MADSTDAYATPRAQEWLDRYVDAWRSKDAAMIGDLWAEDARYYANPWDGGLEGRDAIVAEWLEANDPPGTFDGRYEPVHVFGDVCVARGVTTYQPGHPVFTDGADYHNLFLLRFDDAGRVREYREWYMRRPPGE